MKLTCGHFFHGECLRQLVRHRWSTQRFTFVFMLCPTCKQPIDGIDHFKDIRIELFRVKTLKRLIEQESMKEFHYDGRDNEGRVENPNDRFYKKPGEFAMHSSEFYECSSCSVPFFGGYVNCQGDA